MQNTLTPTFCLEGAQNSMNQFKELMESRPKKENEPFISLNIYQAEKVIQDFKNLQFTKVQRKSFIEIMGLNHLESVSSKTLAFFLNTQEIHNLDDLVISALLNKIGKNISYQIHTENVILEKKTDQGRIDIWVETDEYIIVIENKINHHSENNPFEDYVSHAEKYVHNPQNKELIFILLVVKEPTQTPEKFHLITHFDLSKQILDLLGHKSLQADQYYLTYLIDYISAIEKRNPHSEYGKMQMNIVNFYRNNREVLENIQNEENKESVYQYYEQQAHDIVDLLQDQGLAIIPEDAEFYRTEGDLSSIGGSFNSKTLTSPQNDFQLEFEIYKSTGYTNLWLRRFKAIKMKRADLIELHECLKKEKIPFIEQDDHVDVLLLEETESISAEEFVEKATPLIKQILTLHDIQF
ncbi:PD-(D/E)XK nuclease family protein [Acinetobacter bereziniae]|uniref:PD-(D/E)XK nuclease family protein n=1 Tax=Acinetobacter bereziniae TaxID=106648 RepID=UPI0018FFBA24|nr:PD-(D/E)XK nuclease family protein [Acinetobacter bereziniae]MBJ9901426.1 PD-(D/E)XK nuclease family protein [Acinetobacter bereziniae]MCU4317800.1 PD-(D/E)XK nuclease family protein [Acinetobacter bereziniae]